jgi:crotonobetainyl-CoA:carnitine CoA-transferase CaiB-like acyl-CoA transferase
VNDAPRGIGTRAPLDGVRVLAIEQFGAGPWASLHLVALGAEVIKIEDPGVGGDVGRYVVPFQDGESSLFFETFNGGKRSVSLDLRQAASRTVLEDLAANSDVVFCNLRGDLPARLGLDYRALSPTNPRLVCCSLSGFGATGPRAAQGSYDYAIQGHAGWMSLTGEPDGPPAKSGLSLVDFSAGYAAVIAILAGLRDAERTGRGGDCDVSLFEVALSMNTYVATWSLSKDHVPTRMGHSAHPSLVPFQAFRAKDDWIVICCPKETLFRRLCSVLDLEWMLADPRFVSFGARAAHREVCVTVLNERLAERPAAEWLALLEEAGVPCGPVNRVPDAFRDPQAIARGVVSEYDHPVLGAVRTVRPAVGFDGATPDLGRGPWRGEHTRTVLREACGYSDARVDELAAAGAFGDVGA